jgi:hypothetical protein
MVGQLRLEIVDLGGHCDDRNDCGRGGTIALISELLQLLAAQRCLISSVRC